VPSSTTATVHPVAKSKDVPRTSERMQAV